MSGGCALVAELVVDEMAATTCDDAVGKMVCVDAPMVSTAVEPQLVPQGAAQVLCGIPKEFARMTVELPMPQPGSARTVPQASPQDAVPVSALPREPPRRRWAPLSPTLDRCCSRTVRPCLKTLCEARRRCQRAPLRGSYRRRWAVLRRASRPCRKQLHRTLCKTMRTWTCTRRR
eukprot:TRINITY_DN2701_c0_g1_i1.p1 TRINITY_DN2701_c0_g1~~TRINITY_DN2701_c0_g1_i1.p1  ORF type:complete len:175 (+),score=18.32 TRINITY_DN2701_c0_g1_i1:167-691(+)